MYFIRKYLNPLTFEYGDGTTPTIVSESKTLPSGRSGYEITGTIGVNWDSQSPNEGYAILLKDPNSSWIGGLDQFRKNSTIIS